MEIKGTGFIARRAMLVAEFGEARFDALLARVAAEWPIFATTILASSGIPMLDFFAFNDAVIKEFYDGDVNTYWRFGEQSAEWGLTQGPYKWLIAKGFDAFARSAPKLYRAYFSEGEAESIVGERQIQLWLRGVPAAYRHPYVELSMAGYYHRGLELTGQRKITHRQVTGFRRGDDVVHYRFTWSSETAAPPSRADS